jgi:3-oxoacyl-[acyl-carrier-protein] synthase-3
MAKYISKGLGLPKEKVVVDADKVGNMGSAAIWYSFDQLLKSKRLQRGDKVLVLGAEATKYLYGGFVYQH